LEAALKTAEKNDWYGANVVAGPIAGLGWSRELEIGPESATDAGRKATSVRVRNQRALNELMDVIAANVGQVPDIESNYPPKFFTMKEHVEHAFGAPENDGDGRGVPYFDFHTNRAFRDLGIDTDQARLYLRILNSLGAVHWVGDIDEIRDGTNNDLQRLVFNPEWVRLPVYKLIRDNTPGRIIAWPRLQQLLPVREGDRNNIVGLMEACRLAYRKERPPGLLIPDRLPGVDPKDSEALQAPFNTADAEERRFEADFLPEKVFLRLVAESYERIARPGKECFRNEVQFTMPVGNQEVHALLRPVYSPPDGKRPRLEIIVVHNDGKVRGEAFRVLEHEIDRMFKAEGLEDVQRGLIGVQPAGREPRGRIPGGEANILVRDFLKDHPQARIRAVAAATGLAIASIHNTPAWKDFREKTSKPRREKAARQLTREMLAAINNGHAAPGARIEARDTIWRVLLEKATPDERVRLNAMSSSQKEELIDETIKDPPPELCQVEP
jgi:hypothetical protein